MNTNRVFIGLSPNNYYQYPYYIEIWGHKMSNGTIVLSMKLGDKFLYPKEYTVNEIELIKKADEILK